MAGRQIQIDFLETKAFIRNDSTHEPISEAKEPFGD